MKGWIGLEKQVRHILRRLKSHHIDLCNAFFLH